MTKQCRCRCQCRKKDQEPKTQHSSKKRTNPSQHELSHNLGTYPIFRPRHTSKHPPSPTELNGTSPLPKILPRQAREGERQATYRSTSCFSPKTKPCSKTPLHPSHQRRWPAGEKRSTTCDDLRGRVSGEQLHSCYIARLARLASARPVCSANSKRRTVFLVYNRCSRLFIERGSQGKEFWWGALANCTWEVVIHSFFFGFVRGFGWGRMGESGFLGILEHVRLRFLSGEVVWAGLDLRCVRRCSRGGGFVFC